MLKKLCLSAAVLAVVAMPAFAADECGPLPTAPAFQKPTDLAKKSIEDARKDVVDSYHLVKVYQSQLAPFRSCLERLSKDDQAVIEAAKAKPEDASKGEAAKARIAARQTMYDKTVDSEQTIASDFNTLRVEHCKRGDTDAKVCPQPKK